MEIAQGTHRGNGKAVASFDGDTNIAMNVGDRIVIRRSVKDTRIIKISNISFFGGAPHQDERLGGRYEDCQTFKDHRIGGSI